ncbi:ferredoxin family protein [Lentzea roselyniae]|uniref:Ferredoxin n=1 Tax=Lentzea roselyniae TaxID=531940 RepID=A0ABP7C4Z8_9PSEU
MAYVMAQPCVDVMDKACTQECPVDCVYEGDRLLFIHPEECVDDLGSPGGTGGKPWRGNDPEFVSAPPVHVS